MSYESPIEIIFGEMKYQVENDVYSVVQSYDIKVDKDELIKALKYDREQYQQGYDDAKAELERKKGKWSNYKDEHGCSVCQSVVIQKNWDDDIRYDYCPYCGADMRGDDE